MAKQETAGWPKGVIARYVTVGGAFVDLRHDIHFIHDTEPSETVADCGGCPKEHVVRWEPYRFDNGSRGADYLAREWAQSHAEVCRAMPRPEVA